LAFGVRISPRTTGVGAWIGFAQPHPDPGQSVPNHHLIQELISSGVSAAGCGWSDPQIKDPMGNLCMGASAITKINRDDFGMTSMRGMVGDEVAITIDVELVEHL